MLCGMNQNRVKSRKWSRLFGFAALLLLAVIVLPNLRSLYEGIFFYLHDALNYSPNPPHPVQRAGRYASLFDLVQLRNAERQAYLLKRLGTFKVSIVQIRIPHSIQSNILVRFSDSGPYTIFSAHYDKLFDEIEYQGASDNTAAVSVLLAAVEELARHGGRGDRAFLFTGEEEQGLLGARAFVEYARDAAHPIAIKEIINFDQIGRGKLGIRPSGSAVGFIFAIPFYGDIAYDGHEFRRCPRSRLAPERLTQSLRRAQPETTVYQRFTSHTDSNAFQANGIDTVAISADDMRFLEITWHTPADRVALLDSQNLDLAVELILKYGVSH